MFRAHVLPLIVWFIYKLFYKSWRIVYNVHPEVQEKLTKGEPLVLAHWHGDELAVLHLVKKYKLATMTSTSKDGELINYVIKKFGGDTSRGSSTRGAVGALKGLVRLVKSGRTASIAVDGPKGPIHQVKPGVFEISRLTKAAIVPVGVVASQKFVSEKSWNKAILPKPFTKVVITLDEPLPYIDKETPTKDYKLAEKLRNKLFAAQQHSSNLIASN